MHQSDVAAQAKLDATARFTGLSGIVVVDKTPDEQALRSSYEITYIALTYDMFSNKSLPASNTVVGFDSLPSNVLAYLIERHPDQIPDKIMRLAPNPADAFNRFFVGLARGHLTASNHDVSPVRAA